MNSYLKIRFTCPECLDPRNEGGKVETVKFIRDIFGIGLKEAKDIAEAAIQSQIELHMTFEQFGRWTYYSRFVDRYGDDYWLFSFLKVELIDNQSDIYDMRDYRLK